MGLAMDIMSFLDNFNCSFGESYTKCYMIYEGRMRRSFPVVNDPSKFTISWSSLS
jgi:hypothetical protein